MTPLSGFKRRLPLVRQDANGECGLACLVMIARWHGHRLSLPQLRLDYPTTRLGLNLADLTKVAHGLRFQARGLAIADPADLKRIRLPAMVHWDTNHFVVLKSVRRRRYTIHNPAAGVASFGEAEFLSHFTGWVLEVEPGDNFEVIVRQKKNSLSSILRRTSGLGPSILQVVAMSLTSSLMLLSIPAIVQVALDSVVPKNDVALLQLLALALFAVSASTAFADWIRRRIIANAGISFFVQLTRNAVGHIFRLPVGYSESRHPGDIATRLDSIDHVRNVVVNSLVSAFVDGTMMLLCGVLMFLYIPSLAVMVTSVFLAVVVVRVLMYPAIRRQGAAALREKATERSRLMDLLRAAPALKTANAGQAVTGRWYESLVRSSNAGFSASMIESNVLLFIDILTAITTALVLFYGVAAVMTEGISVGMLYAFFTYRGMFFERIDKLIHVMTDISMLGANMTRLDDFLQMDAEQENHTLTRSLRRGVHLIGVTFKVGFADRPILTDVTIEVPAGRRRWIGIVGPSGSGKTTLMKLLAGLYRPTAGQHLVDGTDLSSWGLAAYRNNIGLLLGSDKLMRGTIAENVACFDDAVDLDRVGSALRSACLADVVDALPGRYNTLVSEENGVLSSGERRRLMIARAIYRDAPILLLDEVTANLDAATTEQVLANLAALPATKVVTTHDLRVLDYCDEVHEMQGGILTPRSVAPSNS